MAQNIDHAAPDNGDGLSADRTTAGNLGDDKDIAHFLDDGIKHADRIYLDPRQA